MKWRLNNVVDLQVVRQYSFADSLAHAKRVHTITDIGDLHSSHTQRAPLPKNDIRMLMNTQPSLEKIVADGRTWTVSQVLPHSASLQCNSLLHRL